MVFLSHILTVQGDIFCRLTPSADNTGTSEGQDSRFFFWLDGMDRPDTRLIHAPIRVHPGWWLGYLRLLLWG